jgi:N6-L-threonylcarbamoyladenine synthase
MKNHDQIKWLGGTRDDAAGECFDKAARVLGLGYPGGPAIAAEAAKLDASRYSLAAKLPRPMIKDDNFDFSFSGLKTAVINEIKKLKNNQQFSNLAIQQLSFEIQEAITDVLVIKTIRAAQKYQVKSILLAGGVTANSRLREKLSSHPVVQSSNYQLFIPPPKLCTDNAAYIAAYAYFNYQPIAWQKISTQPGLSIVGEV